MPDQTAGERINEQNALNDLQWARSIGLDNVDLRLARDLRNRVRNFMSTQFSLGRGGLQDRGRDRDRFNAELRAGYEAFKAQQGGSTIEFHEWQRRFRGQLQTFEEWQAIKDTERTEFFESERNRFTSLVVSQQGARGGATQRPGAGGRLGGPVATFGPGFGVNPAGVLRGIIAGARRGPQTAGF